MSLICNDYSSGSVSVELSQGLDDLIELYKKQCDSQSLPYHCRSYLISISYYVIVCIYTLPWYWLLPSNREDVQEVKEYRMHTAQRKGCEARMRKPVPTTQASSPFLPAGLLLLSFHSADCLSLPLVHRGRGGLDQVRSREWPELLNSQERCLAFLGVPQKVSEKGNCGLFSHFRGICIMNLVLSSSQSAFLKH